MYILSIVHSFEIDKDYASTAPARPPPTCRFRVFGCKSVLDADTPPRRPRRRPATAPPAAPGVTRREGSHALRVLSVRHLGGYLKGQFVSAVAVGILATAALWLLGIRFPYVLGPMVGGLALVPIYGTVLGALLAMAVAGIEGGAILAAQTGVALAMVQVVDNALVEPHVHGQALGIGTLTALKVILVGGIVLAPLLGPLAPLLALPAFAIARDFRRYRALRGAPERLSHAEALARLAPARGRQPSRPSADAAAS